MSFHDRSGRTGYLTTLSVLGKSHKVCIILKRGTSEDFDYPKYSIKAARTAVYRIWRRHASQKICP